MKNFYMSFALLAMMAVGCAREISPEIEQEKTASEETVQAIVPGQAIVQFSDSMIELIEADLASGNVVTKSSELNSITEILGIESMTRLFPDAGEFEPRHREAGLHKWYKVVYSSDVPVTKATSDLELIGGVEFVEPVRNIVSTATFNDPRLKNVVT